MVADVEEEPIMRRAARERSPCVDRQIPRGDSKLISAPLESGSAGGFLFIHVHVPPNISTDNSL